MPIPQVPLEIVLNFLVESTPIQQLPLANAIFVFGHYEDAVAKHAGKLWSEAKAPLIIVTGKGRDKRLIPGGTEEAEFFASVLITRGVPKDAIILEKESTNSLENVVMGMRVLRERIPEPKTLILVAMPPLLKRTCATFRKQFPEVVVHGSGFDMPPSWNTPARVLRILEELERLNRYANEGHIQRVHIPDHVIEAASEACSALIEKPKRPAL